MNGEYLSALPAGELIPAVRRELDQMGVPVGDRDLAPLINAVKARSRTILQIAERVAVRLDPSRAQLDAKGEALVHKMGAAFAVNLERAIQALEALPPDQWAADPTLDALKRVAETHGLKLGDAMQPVRVALTGSTVSEPVNELLAVIDRATALRRLREVARRFGSGGDPRALPA
jgi:glutamyl-tRNA synthetase